MLLLKKLHECKTHIYFKNIKKKINKKYKKYKMLLKGINGIFKLLETL